MGTVLTKLHAQYDSARHFSSDAQITNACSYHKFVTARTTVVTIRMSVTARSRPALKTTTRAPVDAVSHASGSVMVITIVETRAMSHQVFVRITHVIVTRDSSVTRHVRASPSCGSVTGMLIVMMGQTRIWRFAKVRESYISDFWLTCFILVNVSAASKIDIETLSVAIWMARMEMEWKLEKIGPRFDATSSKLTQKISG